MHLRSSSLILSSLIAVFVLALPRFARADLLTATTWLKAAQQTNGSWGGPQSSASPIPSTAAALEAVISVKQSQAALEQKALAWLKLQNAATLDEIAHRLAAYVVAAQTPEPADLQALLGFQALDGGFAPLQGSQSTVLDTALALRVLGLQLSPNVAVAQKAIGYLQAQQRSDGGWAFPGQANDSSAYLTGSVLLALSRFQRLFALQTSVTKAVTFLKGSQAADGSWATGRDKVIATSFATLAIGATTPSEGLVLSKAITFLEGLQAADGSWSQDPFATAYALRALDARKPDLAFDPASLSIQPPILVLGSQATVSIKVQNQGAAAASSVLVRLVRGDPQRGGVTLHEQTIPSLASGGDQIVQLTWSNIGPIGSHYLYVLVDPADQIAESNEFNNSVAAAIQVVPPVDLAIGTKDLSFQPAFPTPGRPIEFSVRVRNLGGIEAQNVEVGFYQGDPQAGGTRIGPLQIIPSIPGGQAAIAKVNLAAGLAKGSYTLFVVVDPNQTIVDSDRTNNRYQQPFDVKERLDLIVQTQGIFFSKPEVFEGDTVDIRVGVYNAEAEEAKDAVLRIFDGDPNSGGTQIGADLKLTIPGQQSVYSPPISYRGAGAAGTHFLYVLIDPDKALPDINRDNNVAIRTIKVVGLPDLAILPADITFTPTAPEESDSLRIYVNVRNTGQVASTATTARFYDRDPATPGAVPIAPDLAIPAINPGAANRPSVLLSPLSPAAKTFWVVINPDQTLREVSTTNNTASASITILPASRPDLTLATENIRISPASPVAGDPLTVEADIRNLYGPDATSVIVRFHDGAPTATNLLHQATLPTVLSGGATTTSFVWNVPATKLSSLLHVVIDPTNVILEKNDTNNTASRLITFGLAQATAPTNFSVTPQGADTLLFQWQAGAGAAAANIYGYRIYCNGGLLNPPTPVLPADITTTVSSEESATYLAANLHDLNISTSWRPNSTSATPFVELAFPQPIPITGVLLYFQTTAATRTFKLQAWVGGAWQDVATGAGTTTEELFFAPVTTDKIRIAFTVPLPTNAPTFTQIRDLRLYRSGLIQGTTFSQAGLVRGDYTCHATAVIDPLRASPSSNSASGRLGDFSPPALPTGVQATYVPASFRTDLRWTPPTDADLYGCRPHASGQNVARWERGATASASSYQTTERLIDGTLTASSYARVLSPGSFLVEFERIYTLDRIVIHLGTGDQLLKVETSLDGQIYQIAADFSSRAVQGRQEIPFPTTRAARYIRLSAAAPPGGFLDVAEVEAFTSELSSLVTDTRFSPSNSFLNYNATSNSWRAYTYDYSPNVARPRRFVLFDVGLDPFDVLVIRDLDTMQILGRISGTHDTYTTGWLNAKRYRFEILPSRFSQTYKGYRIVVGVERTGTSTATYAHTGLYLNGRIDYAVGCIDHSGNESPLTSAAFVSIQDQQAPATPTNFRAVGSTGQVALTWSQSVPSDFKGFRLYRDGQLFKTLPASPLSYTDTDVTNGAKYSYQLSAVDVNDNESAKAGPVEATPSGIDLTIVASGTFSDVFFSPREPSVYESATLAVIVRNLGSQDAPPGATVSLHDGDPKAGGTLIGTITIPTTIPAQTRAIGLYEWKLAQVTPGPHTVWATVNPTFAIPEYDTTNNAASRAITIHADPFLDTHVNQVDASRFPVIDVFMRVRDANGGGIFGLDERHFVLKEDQKVQSPLQVVEIGQPGLGLPKVDIAFVIDTSGSMGTEWATTCAVIDEIRDLLLAYRVDLSYKIYSLQARYSGATCGDPLTTGIWRGAAYNNQSEDWGPGSTWVAKNHTWRSGASRIIIPISDEGAYQGDGWTAEDTETVTEAIAAAKAAPVLTRFYPFWGTEIGGETSTNVIANEMRRMAQSTGGKAFPFLNATQVAQEIVDAALLSVSDYKITYTTSNPTRDGTLRKIDVATSFNVSKGSAQGEYRAPLDNLPDLLFVGALEIVPATPLVGQRTQLKAIVRNNGGKAATAITVHIYDGEPSQGGRLLGLTTIPSLLPGEEKPISFAWQAIPGKTRFVLLIDPSQAITESNEQNNTLVQEIDIPGTRGAELAVGPFDLAMSPDPAIKGLKVTFQATVHNIGTKDAQNVLVAFFLGDPDQGGTALGTASIPSIALGTSKPVTLTWVADTLGEIDLYVVVDPYNTVQEDFEDNNRAHRLFTIAKRQLDLQITTDQTSYPIQTDVKIKVRLQNQTPMLWSGTGEVWIEDEKQNPVEKVSDLTIQNLAPVGLKEWPYRLPIAWTAPASGTKHLFLGVQVDLTAALQRLGVSGKAIDPASLRVVAFDAQGFSLGLLPIHFRPVTGFDPTTKAQGEILLFLKDSIVAGDKRTFYLFFDVVGGTAKPTSLASPAFPQAGWTVAWIEEQGKIHLRERLPDASLAPEIAVFDISVGNDNTRALVLGDFNNDGQIDLIAASTLDRKMYFYPGDPSLPTRFDATKRTDVGAISTTTAVAAVTGDLNKDGKLDVIVSSSTTTYVFLGNGNGTFQAARTYASPSGAVRGKVLLDYNKDGHLDLLYATVGSSKTGRVVLHPGSATGVLGAAQSLITGGFDDPYGFAVADLDGDGVLDVLLNEGTSGVALLFLGDGQGGFLPSSPVPSLAMPTHSAWAPVDWNYDGRLDLFAATYTTKEIRFYEGQADQAWAAPLKLSTAVFDFLGITVAPPSAQLTATAGDAETLPLQTWDLVWNTKLSSAGKYQAAVKLVEGPQEKVAEAAAPFTVEPEIKAEAQLTTDKIAYPPQASVLLRSRVINKSRNFSFDTLAATITLQNPQGQDIHTIPFTLTNLGLGQLRDENHPWSTGVQPPGTYKAILKVLFGGAQVAESTTTFDILTAQNAQTGIRGKIQVQPSLAKPGTSVTISFEAVNGGSQTLTDQEFVVRIFSNADRSEKGIYKKLLTLNPLDVGNESRPFDTTGFAEGEYTIVLSTLWGGTDLALDTALLTLSNNIQRPPLTIKITSPATLSVLPSVVTPVQGEVSDGDAKVKVNGFEAVVTGTSTQASSFALDALSIQACSFTITAEATREQDRASDQVTVSLDRDFLTAQAIKPLDPPKVAATPRMALGKGPVLWLSKPLAGEVIRLTLDAKGETITKEDVTLSGLRDPHALLEDSSGILWVALRTSAEIVRVDVSTTPPTQTTALSAQDGLAEPSALLAAPSGGFFVANAGNGKILRIDAQGKASLFAEGFKRPLSLACRDLCTTLVVLEEAGTVLSTDGAAPPVTLASSLPGKPEGIAYVGEYLVVSDSRQGMLWAIQKDGSTQAVLGGFPGLSGLAPFDATTLFFAPETKPLQRAALSFLACTPKEKTGEVAAETSSEVSKDAGSEASPEAQREGTNTDQASKEVGGNEKAGEGSGEGQAPGGCGCATAPFADLSGLLLLFAAFGSFLLRRRR